MQRNQSLLERELVLWSDGNGKAINDTGQDLQQLADSLVLLILVQEGVEHVVDGLTKGGSSISQLSINSVCDSLQVLSLSRVLTVEQGHQVLYEVVIDGPLLMLNIDLSRNDLQKISIKRREIEKEIRDAAIIHKRARGDTIQDLCRSPLHHLQR